MGFVANLDGGRLGTGGIGESGTAGHSDGMMRCRVQGNRELGLDRSDSWLTALHVAGPYS